MHFASGCSYGIFASQKHDSVHVPVAVLAVLALFVVTTVRCCNRTVILDFVLMALLSIVLLQCLSDHESN